MCVFVVWDRDETALLFEHSSALHDTILGTRHSTPTTTPKNAELVVLLKMIKETWICNVEGNMNSWILKLRTGRLSGSVMGLHTVSLF